jgi:hypothetical protein
MENAIKRIFIALNIKMEFAKAAVMNSILTPTDYAKKSNLDVFTATEFVPPALLHSASHQEAVLLLVALNTLPVVVLLVILALH